MSTSTAHRKTALSLLCAGAKKLGLATVAALTLVSTPQAATDEFVYFHTDMLGSPVAAFSESGEVCWTETYAPYGEKLDKEDQFAPESGCGLLRTDVGYTGHVQDSSGLVYAQQRYYDPVIGRFMSTDPTMPHAGDPRYFGRYQYGANSPYKYTDPNGEIFFAAIAVASIAWSAYDAYQTITDDSLTPTEKAGSLAVDVAVGAVGGVIGKAAYKSYTASKVVDDVVEAADKVDLDLNYKEGWTAAQRAAADVKCQALCDADTVVTPPQRSGTSASSRYKRAGNNVPPGHDVDHVHDLQLGGQDVLSNLSTLDSSVNRSLGAQIQHKIKNLEPGTKIGNVNIN